LKIAHVGAHRGHTITLLTSQNRDSADSTGINCQAYRTFEDLESCLDHHVRHHQYDVIIHSAAVSDYALVASYSAESPPTETLFEVQSPTLIPVTSRGKISSQHAELWLRFRPTPKLIDRFRRDWAYEGLLVKFKLEVGVEVPELKQIASRSRSQSDADLIVANTLETYQTSAIIGDRDEHWWETPREALAELLWQLIEGRHFRQDS
jgi:phosphopantothenoylcysteine synthetase/decarboxylase